jgi:hypothetical protein
MMLNPAKASLAPNRKRRLKPHCGPRIKYFLFGALQDQVKQPRGHGASENGFEAGFDQPLPC